MTLSMNRIWEELSGPLKSFIKKRISNEADADDILQEVFIRINRYYDDLTDDDKLHAWVYRITRNVIADYYRRNSRPVELIEVLDELMLESDEELTANVEIAACLRTMIDDLPEKL